MLLGTISYSFYILQVPVYALERLAISVVTGIDRYEIATMPAFFVLYLITLTGASLASYFWFEKPFRRFIQQRATG